MGGGGRSGRIARGRGKGSGGDGLGVPSNAMVLEGGRSLDSTGLF